MERDEDLAVVRGDGRLGAVLDRLSQRGIPGGPVQAFERAQRISTSATSGRENSTGGRSPRASISRTWVPERLIWSPSILGNVLELTMPPAALLQAVCSN